MAIPSLPLIWSGPFKRSVTPFYIIQSDLELLPEGPAGLSDPWKRESWQSVPCPVGSTLMSWRRVWLWVVGEGGGGREVAASAIDCWVQLLVGICLLNLLSPWPSLIFISVPVSSPSLSCRIKQPALKLHGSRDTICKPCHMAHLASVCGSDGHTYSSTVRNPGPRWGEGGLRLEATGSQEDYAVQAQGGPQGLPVLMWGQKGSVSASLGSGHLKVRARPLPLTLGRYR